MHLNLFFVHMCGKKLLAWGQSGVEPGTFCIRSENHTLDHCLKNLKNCVTI